MTYYAHRIQNGDELYHHGIKGQKWGVRRFQNTDGTRTAAGKKRYSGDSGDKPYLKKDGRVRFGIAGMRRFNASKEEVIERGRALDKQGHNFAKGTLAFIGRDAVHAALLLPVAIGAAAAAPVFPVGAAAASVVLQGAATTLNMANVMRTYQDFHDVAAYRRNEREQK